MIRPRLIRTGLILLCLALAGCGTVEGVGEDISDASRFVRDRL